MRIDEFQPQFQRIRPTDSPKAREVRSSGESGASPNDHVALSNLSRALMAFTPDPARLAGLQAEVQSGTYNVASDKISHRLLDEMIGD